MAASRGVGYRPMTWTLFFLCQIMIVPMVTADHHPKPVPSETINENCEDQTAEGNIHYSLSNFYLITCWIIRIPSGEMAYITVSGFYDNNDGSDYLTISNDDPSNEIYEEVDGTTSMPFSFQINSNIVYVNFISNTYFSQTTFDLHWTISKVSTTAPTTELDLGPALAPPGNWLEFENKIWGDPCNYINNNEFTFTLQHCKSWCVDTSSCNAIIYDPDSNYCELWRCPTPVSPPHDSVPNVNSYILLTVCEFNGKKYHNGDLLPDSCFIIYCEDGKWTTEGKTNACAKCKGYWDPHITRFNKKEYSFQHCGTYSLSQYSNSYNPPFAVYADFKTCGGNKDVTCVNSVSFKNDDHPIITIGFENVTTIVKVNGQPYDVPGTSPTVVEVGDIVYPVLIWRWKDNEMCVNLQGNKGLSVQFCGHNRPEDAMDWFSSTSNDVYVWADYNTVEELQGLCGTINDDKYIDRHGEDYPSSLDPNFPFIETLGSVEFAKSWTAVKGSYAACPPIRKRKSISKRQAQNICVNGQDPDNIKSQCNTSVMNGFPNAEPEEAQSLIDACVFDMCRVSDPDNWMKIVKETVKTMAVIQENTVVMPTPPPPSPPTQPSTPPKPSTTSLPTVMPTPPPTSPPTQPSTSPPTVMPTPPPTSPPTQLSTPPTQSSTSPPTEENEENLYIHVRQIVNNN